MAYSCLLYTSDAADERSSVDLGGRRIIKKKKKEKNDENCTKTQSTTVVRTKRANTWKCKQKKEKYK